jgi:predicted nucleotidyltransferase
MAFMNISDRVLKTLLGELKKGLLQTYGTRLKGVYLFGSYARGEQRSESDVDVLIVLDCLDHYAVEVDRSGELISKLSLKYGLSISRVFVSEADWRHRETPFLINAREEAIPV